MSASYPPSQRRTALAPAVLAVMALLIGAAFLDGPGFLVIRYVVSILTLIVAVFAWQARQWWWLLALVPIAVLWNPVFPIDLGQPDLWRALQYIAAAVVLAAGILIRVTDSDARGPRR